MNRVGQLCALWSPQFLPATLRSNFFFLWCLQFLPRPHPPLSEGTNFSKTDIFTLRTGLSHLDFPREKKNVSLLHCFGGHSACGHASGGMAPETSVCTGDVSYEVCKGDWKTPRPPPSSLSAQAEEAQPPPDWVRAAHGKGTQP